MIYHIVFGIMIVVTCLMVVYLCSKIDKLNDTNRDLEFKVHQLGLYFDPGEYDSPEKIEKWLMEENPIIPTLTSKEVIILEEFRSTTTWHEPFKSSILLMELRKNGYFKAIDTNTTPCYIFINAKIVD